MAKHKYKFNPESLSYAKIGRTRSEKLQIFLTYFIASIVLSVLYFLVFSVFFSKDSNPTLFKIDSINVTVLIYIAIGLAGIFLVFLLMTIIERVISSTRTRNSKFIQKIKNENKFKQNIFIEVPEEFKISVQNFLNSFNNYTRRAKGEIVNFQVYNAENGLICIYEAKTKYAKRKIEKWFNEYVSFIYTQVDEIRIPLENESNKNEKVYIEQFIKSTVMSFLEECNLISPDSLKKSALFKMLGEGAGIKIENNFFEGGSPKMDEILHTVRRTEIKLEDLSDSLYHMIITTLSKNKGIHVDRVELNSLIQENDKELANALFGSMTDYMDDLEENLKHEVALFKQELENQRKDKGFLDTKAVIKVGLPLAAVTGIDVHFKGELNLNDLKKRIFKR